MHRRQAIREAAAAALATISADVLEEQAKRVAVDAPDQRLVTVMARSEGVEALSGTMGAEGEGPEDRRALALWFDVYASAATGKAAVDAINDLEVEIGAALAAANESGGALHALVLDLRWTGTEMETGTEQSRYIAVARIIYTALYDVYYGNPT